MKTALAFAILALFLVIIAVIVSKEHQAIRLPLVQVAAPPHGFVCTPAITPRIRIVRAKEIA